MKKNVINKNIYEKKKKKFWKWVQKTKEWENPNLGLPRVHMLYNCVEYQEA